MKFALVLSTLAIFTASVATVAAQSDMPAASSYGACSAGHVGRSRRPKGRQTVFH